MHPYFKISLTCPTDSGGKFWAATLGINCERGKAPVALYAPTYGAIGSKGQTPTPKIHRNHQENWHFCAKKINEKLKKGYVLDKHNTSKHFISLIAIGDVCLSSSVIAELQASGEIIQSYMVDKFEHHIDIIGHDGEDWGTLRKGETPKKNISKESASKLKSIIDRRKAEAKFEF